MQLRTLQLTHFRNYEEAYIDFAPVTVLMGENAQGKSNILEAIYFLATTKSLRAERDSELIQQRKEFTRIEGLIAETSDDTTKLEIAMQLTVDPLVESGLLEQSTDAKRTVLKRLKVNGVGRRALDYIGNLVVVPFFPEDLNLVTGSPSLRRWHLDLALAQIDSDYKRAITIYSEALVSRNRVLKRIREGLSRLDELDYWTDQLVKSGVIISQKRTDFFTNLNNQTPILGSIVFNYQPSPISFERLQEYQPREIASSSTLIGPHRDDFTFIQNKMDLAHFGSRGEQRTAVLELKLKELTFIKTLKGTSPVLLLDDIFSELDTSHRERVVEICKNQQTILSVIESDPIPPHLLEMAKVYKVKSGSISG
jgi:DNA replication and repair protein RecF